MAKRVTIELDNGNFAIVERNTSSDPGKVRVSFQERTAQPAGSLTLSIDDCEVIRDALLHFE